MNTRFMKGILLRLPLHTHEYDISHILFTLVVSAEAETGCPCHTAVRNWHEASQGLCGGHVSIIASGVSDELLSCANFGREPCMQRRRTCTRTG